MRPRPRQSRLLGALPPAPQNPGGQRCGLPPASRPPCRFAARRPATPLMGRLGPCALRAPGPAPAAHTPPERAGGPGSRRAAARRPLRGTGCYAARRIGFQFTAHSSCLFAAHSSCLFAVYSSLFLPHIHFVCFPHIFLVCLPHIHLVCLPYIRLFFYRIFISFVSRTFFLFVCRTIALNIS